MSYCEQANPPVRAKLSARFSSAMGMVIEQSGDAFFAGRVSAHAALSLAASPVPLMRSLTFRGVRIGVFMVMLKLEPR